MHAGQFLCLYAAIGWLEDLAPLTAAVKIAAIFEQIVTDGRDWRVGLLRIVLPS